MHQHKPGKAKAQYAKFTRTAQNTGHYMCPSNTHLKTADAHKERTKNGTQEKQTRCVPKNQARSAQKAQGGNSPWRRSHSCPSSAPAATPPPLRVSSLTNYNTEAKNKKGWRLAKKTRWRRKSPREKTEQRKNISKKRWRVPKKGTTRKMKIRLGDENFPKKKKRKQKQPKKRTPISACEKQR